MRIVRIRSVFHHRPILKAEQQFAVRLPCNGVYRHLPHGFVPFCHRVVVFGQGVDKLLDQKSLFLFLCVCDHVFLIRKQRIIRLNEPFAYILLIEMRRGAFVLEFTVNGIKVYFQILNQIPQQALIALAYELNIGKPYSLTELSRTHWEIKRINLVEVLEKAGYRVFKL